MAKKKKALSKKASPKKAPGNKNAKQEVKQASKPAVKKTIKKALPQKKSANKTIAKPETKAKKLNKKTALKSSAKTPVQKSPLAKAAKAMKKIVSKAKKVIQKTAPLGRTDKASGAKKSSAPKSLAASASANFSGASAKPKKPVDLTNFVTPLDDRIMVQLSEVERRTAGGLYIPDTVADVSGNLEGVVVAAGRGHLSPKGHLRPMDVRVGDKIVFSQHAGSKILIQNEDLIILREADVMGVVSK